MIFKDRLASMVTRSFHLLHIMRFWDWRDKIYTIIIATLLLLLFSNATPDIYPKVLLFIVYIFFPFIFGYMLNDIADRKIDAQVGKIRTHHFSSNTVFTIVVIFGIATMTFPLIFNNIGIMVTTLIGVGFTILYSVKPFRFKERGLLGLVIVSTTQRLAFIFLLFIIPNTLMVGSYLFGWLILTDVLIETSFQLSDYANDIKTGTKTFAVSHGTTVTKYIIYVTGVLLVLYFIIPIITLSALTTSQQLLMIGVLIIFTLPSFHTTFKNLNTQY
jgi:4-hydroxybenzoate polyprenyltransferase